jgi:uncharacterized protein (TIGR03437 family)
VISPGELIEIAGANLAAGNANCLTTDNSAYRTTCNGTTVYVDGIASAIQILTTTQLTVFVPFEAIAVGDGASIQIVTAGGTSAAFPVTIYPAIPSANTFLDSHGALISAQNLAGPGQVVQAQGYGFGLTNPQAPDGIVSPAGTFAVAGVIQVTVGGVPATILSGSAAMLILGEYGVSFIVPQGLSGNQPVVVTVDGIAGPASTIALGGNASPLSITSSNLGTWSLGEVQAPLVAVGGNGGYTWTLKGGTLPPGLAIRTDLPTYIVPSTGNGLIGVATTPGTYNFSVGVASGSATTNASLTIKISALTLKDGPTLPDGFTGTPYLNSGYQLTATENGTAVAIACSPASVGGFNLSNACLLTGTPTTPGNTVIPVTFSDGADTVTRSVVVPVYAVSITSPGVLPNAAQNQAYSYTLTATGTAPRTFTLSGTLPAGLSLSGATISGTPTGPAGKSDFTVELVDASGYFDAKQMSIDVTVASEPLPQLTPSAGFGYCTVGTGCSLGVSVTAGGTGPFTWTVTGLPPGMDFRFGEGKTVGAIGAGDVELWGAPNQVGTYYPVVTATDHLGIPVTQIYEISAVPLLFDSCVTQANCTPLPPATMGIAYAADLRVLGGTPPYTMYLSYGPNASSPLPQGLWAVSGSITGIPQENGAWTPILSIGDSQNNTLDTPLSLFTAGPATSSTVIATYPAFYVAAGTTFTLQLSACCAGTSYVWTTNNPGISLSSSGLLTVTPTGQGAVFPLIQATQSGNSQNYGKRALSFEFTTAAISSTTLPAATVNVAYNQTLSASGKGAIQWSIAVWSQLPPGLQLNPTTGQITGTPLYPGGYSFQVRAYDGATVAVKTITMAIYTLCDFGNAGVTTVADMQQLLNEMLGKQPARHDLNQDRVVNVADLEIAGNAVLGRRCAAH